MSENPKVLIRKKFTWWGCLEHLCSPEKQRLNWNFSGLPLLLGRGSTIPSSSSFFNLPFLFGFIKWRDVEHSLKAMATPTFNGSFPCLLICNSLDMSNCFCLQRCQETTVTERFSSRKTYFKRLSRRPSSQLKKINLNMIVSKVTLATAGVVL